MKTNIINPFIFKEHKYGFGLLYSEHNPALLVKVIKNIIKNAIIILQFFLENSFVILKGHTIETALSAVVIITNHMLVKIANCGTIIYDNIHKVYTFIW